MKWDAYLKLMRLNKPIGILLLWAPTAWALWIAGEGMPRFSIGVLFFLGTLLMRSAGCVINDIADRHIDLHVERTRTRPLTSGEISLTETMGLVLSLLFIALLVLTQLPKDCFHYAFIAVVITMIYPFSKRYIQCPQLILGLAFSMGIPMAFSSLSSESYISLFFLLTINFLWVVAYDTEYAMVDRKDDLKIGVKSTAIFFGQYDTLAIKILQIIFHGLWLGLGLHLNYGISFFVFWIIGLLNLLSQQKLITNRQPEDCFKAFIANGWYGLIMWLALVVNTF